MDDTATNPRIVVTTPSDQEAYARTLLAIDPDDAPESEPPDPGADATAPVSDPDTDTDTDTDETADKAPRGVGKKLAQLEQDRAAEAARADALQAQLERTLALLEKQLPHGGDAATSEAAAPQDAPPDPEQFAEGELDRGYIKALARFEARQEFAALQQQAEQAQAVAAIVARETAAKAKYSDYSAVVNGETLKPLIETHRPLVNVIAAHELGPDIAYYLGKHPDEVRALSAMAPVAALLKVGQLVGQLQTPQPVPATPAAPPISQAPAPVTPLRGVGDSPALTLQQRLEALERKGDYDGWRKLKHAADR